MFRTAARYAKFHFGATFAIARHHQFVWRSPFNLTVDRPSAWNRKCSVTRPEPVRVGETANDFQVDFWNALAFFRHVQFIDHFIGGGLDLWNMRGPRLPLSECREIMARISRPARSHLP